jgi:hypothetical protein|tara:strand:+ start:3233 stop:3667 length:435 start_codon:yes stop_codon:yes gene_type:complete
MSEPIPRDEPFVVPAKPEETFDSVWLRSINIYVPNTAEADPMGGSVDIEMIPYDGEAEKVLVTPDAEGAEYIRIPNRNQKLKGPFWQMINEVPEAALAMNAIIAAIPAIRAWTQEEQPPFDPPSEDDDATEEQDPSSGEDEDNA